MRRIVLLSFAVSIACGPVAKKAVGAPTGDAGTKACSTNNDCAGAPCIQGICGTLAACNSDVDCLGSSCDVVRGLCYPTDGGDTGGGAPCVNHYTCGAVSPTMACMNGACGAPHADGTCGDTRECPLGQVCNLTNRCEPGCVEQADCTNGLLCNPSSKKCEACGSGNDCPSGQSCVNEKCVGSMSCTTYTECAPGLACTSHVCGNCSVTQDCLGSGYGAGTVCSVGRCTPPPCNDQQCQAAAQRAGDPRYLLAYCNLAPPPGQQPGCDKHQCNADSDCPQSANPESCVSHACINRGGSPDGGSVGTNCNPPCSAPLICDPAGTGQCVPPGSSDGGTGLLPTCRTNADCPSGQSCFDASFLGLGKVCVPF